MRYSIEHQIHSLSHNAIKDETGNYGTFVHDGVKFSDRDFNYVDGWKGAHWIATGDENAANGFEAINSFRKKLANIVPKIALIGQAYIDFALEPWLLRKENTDIALFRLSRDRAGGGLMFMEDEEKALKFLLHEPHIPKEFYAYWNDATNTYGYSAKLLLMFSALEALCKKTSGKKDWEKIRRILGQELVAEVFGTQEDSDSALRNRLVHGEYFAENHLGKDYVDLIHKCVIRYFNEDVLKENLLELQIVSPQRHPFGVKEGGFMWLKMKSSEASLKDLLKEFASGEPQSSDTYDMVFDQKAELF